MRWNSQVEQPGYPPGVKMVKMSSPNRKSKFLVLHSIGPRKRACRELGIEPQIRAYDGLDPLGHAVSLNLMRRHMSESQKALLALKLQPKFEERAAERQKATQPKPGQGAVLRAGKSVATVSAPGQQPSNQDLVINYRHGAERTGDRDHAGSAEGNGASQRPTPQSRNRTAEESREAR